MAINKIPTGWALCDGRIVGGVSTPNLSGRFIVGYSGTGDYRTIGSIGGMTTVTLTSEQMPSHSHPMKDYYFAEANLEDQGTEDGHDFIGKGLCGSADTDRDNSYLFYINHDTGIRGNNLAHENRPPYYVLAFIIKL